jgi:hypothetical protein
LLSYVSFSQPSGLVTPLPRIDKEFLVVVHIITNKDSIPAEDKDAISEVLSEVNQVFAPIGAKFTICDYRYIYNFQYQLRDDTNSIQIFRENMLQDRINIFYVYDIKTSIAACGVCEFVPGFNGIFIKRGCNDKAVLSHELGHYFGLPHTFRGNGEELADGSNCSTHGDMICDTPADPYDGITDPLKYVDRNCLFIHDGKDAKGNYYDPDVSNIMSYYRHCECVNFTKGQFEAMYNYYKLTKGLW